MIELRNVTKRFGDATALQNFSLSVPKGETTVLIGPSGCGKSTALRMVVSLVKPDSGTVLFDGKEVTDQTKRDIRHRTGYVIQEGGLFPHLTSRENMTIMAHQLNWSEKKIQQRIDELIKLTSIDRQLLNSYPDELSGGQRQRISLMRGLFLDPDALLLDEPLGALDPIIRRDMQEELRGIFRKLDKTVLLVTHDMDEAAFFGHNIALMKEGSIEQYGSLEDLLNRPNSDFVTGFIKAQRSTLAEMEELL